MFVTEIRPLNKKKSRILFDDGEDLVLYNGEIRASRIKEQEDARDEYELAKSAAFAKLGTPHRLDEKEYRRAAGFLMRKGFGSSEIRRALEEYQDSADEEF